MNQLLRKPSGPLQTRLFGGVSCIVRTRFFSSSDDSKEKPRLYEAQLLELKKEREALFGFSQSDHSAWSNAGNNHRHDQSFLEEINEARVQAVTRSSATNLQQPPQRTEVEAAASTLSWKSTSSSNSAIPPVTPPVLSHVSDDGTSVHMVDVGHKQVTQRIAVAQSRVVFPPEVVQMFRQQGQDQNELVSPKGPIFATAKIAGIMAAKRTSELIPLCHPLPLDKVDIDIRLYDSVAVIQCECRVHHKTGVEMEALTGATVAALTIYDMVKAVSHRIRIEDTVLLSKSGGKRTV